MSLLMSLLQKRTSTVALVALTTLVAAAGVAQAQGSQPAPRPAQQPSATINSASATGQGASAGVAAGEAKARADSARYPYTAGDVRFMSSMIGHHAQAIVMANLVPTHGVSPAVRRLADRIINAQQDEITTMQGWLRDRRQPVPEARPMGAMEMDGMKHEMAHDSAHAMSHASSHEMLMPGMLTDAQMHQLEQAKGSEFDRLFLTFMIQHHRGATSMVQTLFGTYGAAQDEVVFKFASDVNVDQTTEIARMEQMLAAMPTALPAAPHAH